MTLYRGVFSKFVIRFLDSQCSRKSSLKIPSRPISRLKIKRLFQKIEILFRVVQKQSLNLSLDIGQLVREIWCMCLIQKRKKVLIQLWIIRVIIGILIIVAGIRKNILIEKMGVMIWWTIRVPLHDKWSCLILGVQRKFPKEIQSSGKIERISDNL